MDHDEIRFDHYAGDYDAALDRGISVSGEKKEYFARSRITWVAECLEELQERPHSIMDYGCGTGTSAPFFLSSFPGASLVGVDVSPKSLEVARQTTVLHNARFFLFDEYQPHAEVDLAFSNGVFHHIAPNQRSSAIRYVRRSLRPGGLFALWENNPWNPGTRYVMRRIPFDRDAIPMSCREARRLLRAEGFRIISTHFLFLFPRALRALRKIEPFLATLPLGAQYQVLCRKM
jgi:trans-aconitate methyltransferase